MKCYVIERDIPGVGSMSREQLKNAALISRAALEKLRGKAQWQHSYVAGDKTFCIFLADSMASIREHALLSGLPASKITEAHAVIDPMASFG
jgi:hypothetical protein